MGEIKFGNFRWEVRNSRGLAGPGPNHFDPRNVMLLPNGSLRLEVVQREGTWTCAELQTKERLGLGSYQFWLVGRPDLLDPQLVFGFFPYPTPDIGPDGTHELDIEFARWGEKAKPCGNFTVCPTVEKKPSTTHPFPLSLTGEHTTHRMIRNADRVIFSSHHGHRAFGDAGGLIERWEFTGDLSRAAMPLHLNLWLFRGKAPQNAKPAALTLKRVEFTPA
jgi:hypothetical protein